MSKVMKNQKSEYGGAGVKLAIILVVLFLVAHAGYNYIPVAYESENFKQEMQTAVVQGVALPGANITIIDSVKNRVLKAAANNNVPSNALIEVKQINSVVQAHVKYTKQIEILPFGLYVYNYQFENTATPTGFLFK
ncbi:MAG: hypothetical protein ACR2MG_02195 [Pyrinomonadaceae bacterium]